MAQIIKVTARMSAQVGDYLLIEKENMRVISGEAFDAMMAAPKRRATDRAAAMPQTPSAPKATRAPFTRPRSETAIKREAEILSIVAGIPGSKSPEIGTLLAEKIANNQLTACLDRMSKLGLVRREPAVGPTGRMVWTYFPKAAPA